MNSYKIYLKNERHMRDLILSVFPKYKKPYAYVSEQEEVTLSGRYWSGGSIDYYALFDMRTGKRINLDVPAPKFPFTTPDPVIKLEPHHLLIQYGIFNGKPATVKFYRYSDNGRLLPFSDDGDDEGLLQAHLNGEWFDRQFSGE